MRNVACIFYDGGKSKPILKRAYFLKSKWLSRWGIGINKYLFQRSNLSTELEIVSSF